MTNGQTPAAAQGVTVHRLPRQGLLKIQLRGPHPDVCQRLGDAFGARPPRKSGTSAVTPQGVAIWLSPDAWLIVTAAEEVPALTARFSQALEGTTHLVSDVSHAHSVFEVAGKDARGLLARVCALDLHPPRFSVGDAARSLMVRIPLLIHMHDAAPTYRLFVDRSFSSYAADWLVDACDGLRQRVDT
ncbi:MAG: hypothetical protein MI755_03680 [Sphingomonadales bacterium]|nr:hypothetical protein [Sphingomonadales bacterium]